MSTESQETPAKLPLIVESKLYTVLRSKSFFDHLTPTIDVLMATEIEIEEMIPRLEEDGDATRILVNYVNPRGNSSLYKILDSDRLARRFDIDGFMNGLVASMQESATTQIITEDEDSDKLVATSVLFALNMALGIVMQLDNDPNITKATKGVSEVVLRSLIALIFNDAKDVIIGLVEKPSADDPKKTTPTIAGMWVVKERENPQLEEVVDATPSADQHTDVTKH